MATLEQLVLALPVGKANAMKAPAFEEAIGNRQRGTNNDHTRKDVKDAILGHRIPIGSTTHGGYWLIDSDAECQEIVSRIDGTIRELEARRDAVLAGWTRRKASKCSGVPWPK